MAFVPLSRFKKFYSSAADLFNEEERTVFIQKISALDEATLRSEFHISTADRTELIQSYSNPKLILFYAWVESNPSLLKLLSEDKVQAFTDHQSIKKHASYDEFRKWISPFLADVLLNHPTDSAAQKAVLSSFLCLLAEDHALLVEQHFFKGIQTKLTGLHNNLEKNVAEKDLLLLVSELCSDETIRVLNAFSKLSYVNKRQYIDTLLHFVVSDQCSLQLANWVLKRLDLLDLNTDHHKQIQEVHQQLKSGLLKANLPSKKKVNPSRFSLLFFGVFLLCGLLLMYVLNPAKSTKPEPPEKTSFSHFSKEERKHIDSLIAQMAQPLKLENEEVDPNPNSNGSGSVLKLRKPFQNKKMEALYEDLNKDAELALLQSYDTCPPHQTFKCLPGVTLLSGRKEGQEALFRNESEYEVILYIAGPLQNDAVYSALIKPGESKIYKLSKGDYLTIVAGNHFTTYLPPNRPLAELPSQKLTHHFCVSDLNYSETINSAYTFHPNGKKAKFMVSGKKGYAVQLIDVYKVLQAY